MTGREEEIVRETVGAGEFDSAEDMMRELLGNYKDASEEFALPDGWAYREDTPEQVREHILRGIDDVRAGRTLFDEEGWAEIDKRLEAL